MLRFPTPSESPAIPRAGSRGAWLTLLLAVGFGVVAGAPRSAAAQGADSRQGSEAETSPTVFDVPRRTNPLATADDADVLRTPQSTVAFFLEAARAGDWRAAGRTFDVRLLEDPTAEEVATLARKLHEVLLQELGVDWTLLPDRPDGLDEGSAVGGNAPMIGEARRSISLGTIDLSGRPAPVRINRVAPEDGSLRWLFAAGTVRDIEALHARHGPSPLAESMPEWTRTRGWWRVPYWQWIALGLLLLLAPPLAILTARTALPLVKKWLPGAVGPLVRDLQWPVATALTLGIVWTAVDVWLALPANVGDVVGGALRIAFIIAVGWALVRGIHFAIEHVAKRVLRDRTDEHSSSRRRLLTQLTVVRHLLVLSLVILTIAVMLIEFNVFRTIGVMLMTSAGVAAVVFGIAGHAVLGNLVAGLQIALVQPFRIGDTVNVQGNWGTIEDVTYTYVIVNTWDKRRLVVPIRFFIQESFENWARTDRFLQKPISLAVDFRADVDRIREKFLELIREDEDWDEEDDEPTVLVTTSDEETMTVRLTAGGATPSRAWSLECRTRERLLAWLREVEDGAWLPRRRAVLEPSAAARSGEREDDGRWSTREAIAGALPDCD